MQKHMQKNQAQTKYLLRKSWFSGNPEMASVKQRSREKRTVG